MADFINSVTTGNSVLSNLLTELGYNGWTLQNGSYNGCSFASFVSVPILQNNPIVQNGLNLYASINEITGTSPFGSDTNGLGRLFNTILGTLQFRDELIPQTVVKQLPFSNRVNTEAMGFAGYTFRMTLLFLGPDYQKAIRNFENAVLNPPSASAGVLVHPTRGLIAGTTRVLEPIIIDTSLAYGYAATITVTFRSELSTGGNVSVSSIQNFINALEAALGIITGISSSLAALGAIIQSGNRFFSGQSSNQINSQYQSVVTQTNSVSSSLFNNVNYVYQTANTGVTNSTFNAVPINYTKIPLALNQVTTFAPAQGNIIMNDYIQQCSELIRSLELLPFNSQANNLINNINTSVGVLNDVCVTAINYVPTINYVTPRLMSIREVVAQNSIPFSSIPSIMALNPNLLSANYIPRGTTVIL